VRRASRQTEFSNTYAVFEALPEGEKQSLQQLAVMHTIESIQRKNLSHTHGAAD
jgi:alpha-ketoglutarate-dependent taurine dioxygenase